MSGEAHIPMISAWPRWLLALAACLAGLPVPAAPASPAEEPEDWLSGGAAQVNEGNLRFLPSPPARPVHHHQNRLHITANSLAGGWIGLKQCHDRLDAVPATQITFREGYVRKLRVLRATGIGKAWVEGPSVQLQNVAPGARLCLAAETRALLDAGGGRFDLNNGPYMRKFLDGYYPMRVTLEIEYPARLLRVLAVFPPEQAGFRISRQAGRISIDTFFEGELRTLVQFQRLH